MATPERVKQLRNILNRFGRQNAVSVGGAFSGGESYSPSINYEWFTETDVTGDVYLVDSGASSQYPALLATGRALEFNGVDMSISTTISGDVQTIYIFKDDVHTYDETTQTLVNYTIAPAVVEQHSNHILYNGIFTDSQKAYLENYPHKFLYREDNILKSQILSQSEIDNVVAYLPMCESDDVGGYVADLVEYSEVETLNHTLDTTLEGWAGQSGGVLTLVNSAMQRTSPEAWGNANYYDAINIILGKTYLMEFEVTQNSYPFDTLGIMSQTGVTIPANTTGKFSVISTVTNSSYTRMQFGNTTSTITTTETQTIDNVVLTELTGVHQITNYLDTMRVINQSKGLQTCFLERDSLGIPTASSFDAFQSDGVGYADTTFIPSGVFQVEEVVVIGGVAIHYVYDENGNKFTDGIADGTYTIPITSVLLDGTTFDVVSGVESYRLWNVHTEAQDPLKLYNDAVAKGLLA